MVMPKVVHKPVLKLSALRDFLSVVDRGSLRAAARFSGGSQAAVSRKIRQLETRLGVVLFERSVSGAQLTALGKVFHARVKAVQTELERAEEELEQLRGKMHGHVTVALSAVAQFSLLPDAVGPFCKKYPDVQLSLVDGLFPRIEGELRSGAIDAYVGPVPEDVGTEFRVEKLFDNVRVVVGRKGHPLSTAKSLSELTDARWATTNFTARAEAELAPLFESYGFRAPRPITQLQHTVLSTLVLIAKTDLLILLPVQWVRSPLWSDAVQTIAIKEVLPGPAIKLACRSALPLTPAASYFCEMMRQAAPKMRPSMKAREAIRDPGPTRQGRTR